MTDRPGIGARTISEAFREGNSDAIKKVLLEIEIKAGQTIKSGLSETNFTIGVLNCFLVTFVFARYPEHFWLLFVVQAMILFPIKVYMLKNAKPFNQLLYLLDYCWVMNTVGVIMILFIIVGGKFLSDAFREHMYLAAYGTAIGPLFGANTILPFIALIFHKVDSMTSVFIHLGPSLLFYTFRWNSDEIKNAWPSLFQFNNDIRFWSEESFVGSVFGNTMLLYLAWFIPYCWWITNIGLDLPRKKHFDTVFHSNARQGFCVYSGIYIWSRSMEQSNQQVASNDFELRDLAVYMSLHLFASFISMILVAYPSFLSQNVHGTFLVIILIMCTYRGAQRYTYYSTKMYSSIIRKQFAEELGTEVLGEGEYILL